jgi:hypothetical protein
LADDDADSRQSIFGYWLSPGKKASQEMNISAEINLDMALCEFIEQRNNQNFWGRL